MHSAPKGLELEALNRSALNRICATLRCALHSFRRTVFLYLRRKAEREFQKDPKFWKKGKIEKLKHAVNNFNRLNSFT